MIEAKNIYFSYDNKIIADNISLHLDKGELCTLAGINGCGKTTLMRIISGSVSPCKGNLYADGIEYNKYTKKELAKVISYLPQTRNIPSMTVEQLVSHGRFPHLGFSRIMTTKDKEAVKKALYMTKLEDMSHRNLKTLSGGERQRAYIAMTLAQDTDYILLDEPTTYLDINHKFEIMELLSDIKKSGKGILAVLHDIDLACRYSDRMLLMKNSEITYSDSPDPLISDGRIQELFNIKCTIENNHYIFDIE